MTFRVITSLFSINFVLAMSINIEFRSFHEQGDCDYWKSENINIINIYELTDDFEKIMDCYQVTEPYHNFHPEVYDRY